ncbi:MAG: hypothetical protein E6R08_01125 [Nevskiaceae bacterium]|nr:MAG: hypothetical protein E6R08_01125 [Nevskiaceae bacterium]
MQQPVREQLSSETQQTPRRDATTDKALRRRLVAWINEHDTGAIKPTAIDCGVQAGIQVFGEAVRADGEVVTTVDVIHNYSQAREVLGY